MDKHVFENIHAYMHRASSIGTRTEGTPEINEDPSDIPPDLDRDPHLLQLAHDTAYDIDRIFTGDAVAKLFVVALLVLCAHSCKQRLSNNPCLCNLFSQHRHALAVPHELLAQLLQCRLSSLLSTRAQANN